MTSPVDLLLTAIEAGDRVPDGCYAEDAVLDATVPNWRFAVHGAQPIGNWWKHFHGVPAHFEHVRREPTSTGEVVEYTLSWQAPDGPHAVHHCHLLDLRDGAIATDTMFCGGQWGPAQLAEMATSG